MGSKKRFLTEDEDSSSSDLTTVNTVHYDTRDIFEDIVIEDPNQHERHRRTDPDEQFDDLYFAIMDELDRTEKPN